MDDSVFGLGKSNWMAGIVVQSAEPGNMRGWVLGDKTDVSVKQQSGFMLAIRYINLKRPRKEI